MSGSSKQTPISLLNLLQMMDHDGGFEVIYKFRFKSNFFSQNSINDVLELGEYGLLPVVA